MKKSVIYFTLLALLLGSCENQPEEKTTLFDLAFDARFKDQPFQAEEVYWDDFGNRLRVDNFMGYITFVKLVKSDDSEVLVKDFSLIHFGKEVRHMQIEVEPGNYKGIRFGLGIPKDYNKNIDPTIYPNTSPLSIAGCEGMFWHWNTGYIFTKFEGKADTTGTDGAELLHSFSFHIGDDPFYAEFSKLDMNFSIGIGETKKLTALVQVDKVLADEDDPIDLATDFITHTSGNTALAQRFVHNYKNAFTVQ